MPTVAEVIAIERTQGEVRINLRVPPDLVYFDGHFPDCPLLPGVVQVEWAILYGRKHFQLHTEFRKLSVLKFMRLIEPGAELALVLRNTQGSARLTFEYRERDRPCSSGTVEFAA